MKNKTEYNLDYILELINERVSDDNNVIDFENNETLKEIKSKIIALKNVENKYNNLTRNVENNNQIEQLRSNR